MALILVKRIDRMKIQNDGQGEIKTVRKTSNTELFKAMGLKVEVHHAAKSR